MSETRRTTCRSAMNRPRNEKLSKQVNSETQQETGSRLRSKIAFGSSQDTRQQPEAGTCKNAQEPCTSTNLWPLSLLRRVSHAEHCKRKRGATV